MFNIGFSDSQKLYFSPSITKCPKQINICLSREFGRMRYLFIYIYICEIAHLFIYIYIYIFLCDSSMVQFSVDDSQVS